MHRVAPVPRSEQLAAETADTYAGVTRAGDARRADRHSALDLVLTLALIVGPAAVLVSRLRPGFAATAAAIPLLALVASGVALGSLPDAASLRRRRLAIAVMVVAIASMFLIVRTT